MYHFLRSYLAQREGCRSRLRARSRRCSVSPPGCHSLPLRFESPWIKRKRRQKPSFSFWRRGRDSNPRVLSHKLISSQPRYDHFDTSAYSIKLAGARKLPDDINGAPRYVPLRCPKFPARLRSRNFDRCHSVRSLYLPPAALATVPTSIPLHSLHFCNIGIIAQRKCICKCFYVFFENNAKMNFFTSVPLLLTLVRQYSII